MFSLLSLSKSTVFTRVALVSHLCCLCNTRVAPVSLVLDSCCIRVACVTRVWHSCCKLDYILLLAQEVKML